MAFMAAALPSIIGALATTVFTSMMKEDAPAPAATPQAAAPLAQVVSPVVEPPAEMPASPTSNSQEARAAQRRSIATQMARRGRASTILTDNADAKLGG